MTETETETEIEIEAENVVCSVDVMPIKVLKNMTKTLKNRVHSMC